MTRIVSFDQSWPEVLVVMAEGNPGALAVCLKLMKHGDAVDPEAFAGGLGAVLELDESETYGSRIWRLFKDVCGQDIGKTVAVLRARQLGILSRETYNHAIDTDGEGMDVDVIVASVCEQLDRFNPEARAPGPCQEAAQ